MHYANHEECLPTILNRPAKVGEQYYDKEFGRMYTVYKILPRGKFQYDIQKYAPKNYQFKGTDGYATWSDAVDPANKHDYVLLLTKYLKG